jgi:aspartyl-tRNA(Asn)/glutamyl-tRNA(Gln) amidotransferase subunit C
MAITLKSLQKIALMAHIDPKDAEMILPKTVSTLQDIEILKQVDTTNIEPLTHPSASHQYLRKDEVSNDSHIKELEDIAPSFEDGHFLVPNTLIKGK